MHPTMPRKRPACLDHRLRILRNPALRRIQHACDVWRGFIPRSEAERIYAEPPTKD